MNSTKCTHYFDNIHLIVGEESYFGKSLFVEGNFGAFCAHDTLCRPHDRGCKDYCMERLDIPYYAFRAACNRKGLCCCIPTTPVTGK
jgi:hypothetical protein